MKRWKYVRAEVAQPWRGAISMGGRSSRNMVGRDCCWKSIGVETRGDFVVQTRLGSSGLITQVFLVLISCEREGEDGLILWFLW